MTVNENNLIVLEGEQSQKCRTVDMASRAKRTKWKSMSKHRLQQSRKLCVAAIAVMLTVSTNPEAAEMFGMSNLGKWREAGTTTGVGIAEDQEMTAGCTVMAFSLVHVAMLIVEPKKWHISRLHLPALLPWGVCYRLYAGLAANSGTLKRGVPRSHHIDFEDEAASAKNMKTGSTRRRAPVASKWRLTLL